MINDSKYPHLIFIQQKQNSETYFLSDSPQVPKRSPASPACPYAQSSIKLKTKWSAGVMMLRE
jgi:hypothetical protein